MARPGDSSSFLGRTIAAFVIVISLLTIGVVAAVRRLDEVASARVGMLRAEEWKIAAVERLRWSAERMVSAGRGYLVSGRPDAAAGLESAVATFSRNLERLEQGSLTEQAQGLVRDVERAAEHFRARQQELVSARAERLDGEQLARRFEEELRPTRDDLSLALDQLVQNKLARLEETYAQMARDRARSMSRTWLWLGALVLAALAIAALFARVILRAYRAQQEAHARTQRALSAREELLGIVAHDLRNPLGAIAMKASHLRRTAEAEAVRKHAASIENVAVRMEHIIRSLLDLASVDAGRFSISPARCQVADLLHETTDLFDSVAAAKSIELARARIDPDLAVHADRDRILQVLSNLVGNALKFTPKGGRVAVAAERNGSAAVTLTVADTGPGITADEAPLVFERFWKQDKGSAKGTGLGLFIARQIVEAHGGRIWFTSDPAPGTTFHVVLPAAAPSDARPVDLERERERAI